MASPSQLTCLCTQLFGRVQDCVAAV